ncbi:DNA-binding transcription factor [Lithospermum erythrorhizon]|uniref:DNA-binding transcription factor n=1 Tax=Lithospermum erythrorhizon TaxID=34254 RepID=A0AAV3R7R3_LITER
MASTTISNTIRSNKSRNNNKMKKTNQNQHQTSNNTSILSWKSESQQQAYSCKLLQALHHLHITSPPPTQNRGKAVREAADQALAVAAKGKTRWSRAILTNKLKLKFLKKNNNINKRVQRSSCNNIVTSTNITRLKQKVCSGILRLKVKNIQVVQRKVKVLGKLVPGCRKEALPVLLEEAGDYIAALEMQVRAMSALAELLSGSQTGSSTSRAAGSLD